MKKQICTIRKDILSQNLAVPIGDEYYAGKEPLKYRWRKDVFQVFYNGKWQYAKSIDFDFVTN